jgi:hypothetical protein
MKIKKLYEDARYRDSQIKNDVKEFIYANKDDIDSMASEELWEEIYNLLISNFPDCDEDILITTFNKEYGTPPEQLTEDGEEEDGDFKKTDGLPGMSYTSWARSALGVSQKLTESSIKRLKDF